MFKEQLHTAFDNISPSPELLDRISAMMNEEVNRKKAPLRMNAVRYAGIAAALALAAGGTVLVINNANNNIKTSESSQIAGKSAVMQESVSNGADHADADSGKASEDIAKNNINGGYDAAAEEAPAAGAADEPIVPMAAEAAEAAGNDSIAEAQGTEDNNSIFDDSHMIMAPSNEEAAPEQTTSTAAAKQPADMEAETTSQAAEKRALDEAAAEEASTEDNDTAEDSTGYAGAEAPSAPDTVMSISADPGTGITGTDPFIDIRTWSLSIPSQLEDLVDGIRTVGEDGEAVYGEKWYEYTGAVYFGANDGTGIENDLNIYTFIKYFNIPTEDARAALYEAADTKTGVPGISLTREEADIILTMDIEKITAAFANPYAIVKGNNIYTPSWLLSSDYDDYRAAGITRDDILGKYDLITTMSDIFGDAVIDADIQAELNAKLDGFLTA